MTLVLGCDFTPDLTTGQGRRCAEAVSDEATTDPADGTQLALFGCCFLLIGAVVAWRRLWFFRSAARTTGTVVDLRVRQHDEAADSHHPVVHFVTLDGTTERFTDDTGAWRKRYQVGQTVAVAYDPRYPGRARVPWWGAWATPLVLLPLGGMLVVVGLLLRSGRL